MSEDGKEDAGRTGLSVWEVGGVRSPAGRTCGGRMKGAKGLAGGAVLGVEGYEGEWSGRRGTGACEECTRQDGRDGVSGGRRENSGGVGVRSEKEGVVEVVEGKV